MVTYRQVFRTIKKVMTTVEKFQKNKSGTTGSKGNSINPRSGVGMTLAKVDTLSGVDFELFCGQLLANNGYKVETTKASGDYGADLVLYGNNKKIVVQTKRYSKNIGVSAVQEIVSAKPMYNADESWVITNQYFTKNAINLARANNVQLIDRDGLSKMIR